MHDAWSGRETRSRARADHHDRPRDHHDRLPDDHHRPQTTTTVPQTTTTVPETTTTVPRPPPPSPRPPPPSPRPPPPSPKTTTTVPQITTTEPPTKALAAQVDATAPAAPAVKPASSTLPVTSSEQPAMGGCGRPDSLGTGVLLLLGRGSHLKTTATHDDATAHVDAVPNVIFDRPVWGDELPHTLAICSMSTAVKTTQTSGTCLAAMSRRAPRASIGHGDAGETFSGLAIRN